MGDTARTFQQLARERGIAIEAGTSLRGLTNRGHVDEVLAGSVPRQHLLALRSIFTVLGGDEATLASKSSRALQPDFVLGTTGQLVELDESQHFTSARLSALDHYPSAGLRLGFDVAEYGALCRRFSPTSDRDFAHKQAAEFPGPNGRQRQRAYFDAIRDFAAPALGVGPVIRVPCPTREAGDAVDRLCVQLGRR